MSHTSIRPIRACNSARMPNRPDPPLRGLRQEMRYCLRCWLISARVWQVAHKPVWSSVVAVRQVAGIL